jgi:hypothetical protein
MAAAMRLMMSKTISYNFGTADPKAVKPKQIVNAVPNKLVHLLLLPLLVKRCNKELVISFFKESRFRRRMPVNRCCVQRTPKLSSTTFRSSYQIHIQRETFKPDLLRVLFPKSRAIYPHLYATSLKSIAPRRRRFATSENQSPDGGCSNQPLRKAVNKAAGKEQEEEDDRYQSFGRSVDILLRKRGEILLLLRSSHTSGRCSRCRSHGLGSCNGRARLRCRREHILVRFTTFRDSGSSGVFFFFTTIQHKEKLFLPQQFFNTKRFLAAKVRKLAKPSKPRDNLLLFLFSQSSNTVLQLLLQQQKWFVHLQTNASEHCLLPLDGCNRSMPFLLFQTFAVFCSLMMNLCCFV